VSGEPGKQDQAQDVIEDRRRDDDLAGPRLEPAEIHENAHRRRHRGYGEGRAQEESLSEECVGRGEKGPTQADAQSHRQNHTHDRHREGPSGVLDEPVRLQLHAGEQHDEEHAQVGDGVEYGTLAEPGNLGKRISVLRRDSAKHDAGDQLSHQGRLTQPFGYLTKRPRGYEKNE
jgi:hypothetical protein